MKTNKNTKGQSQSRLQSLDAAELARVTGGATMCELRAGYEKGTGWYEFFDAAGNCTPYYLCFPG